MKSLRTWIRTFYRLPVTGIDILCNFFFPYKKTVMDENWEENLKKKEEIAHKENLDWPQLKQKKSERMFAETYKSSDTRILCSIQTSSDIGCLNMCTHNKRIATFISTSTFHFYFYFSSGTRNKPEKKTK